MYCVPTNPPIVIIAPRRADIPMFVYTKGIEVNMKADPKAPRSERPVVLYVLIRNWFIPRFLAIA